MSNKYEFVMERDDVQKVIIYDPHNSTLVNEDGTDVLDEKKVREWKPVHTISPEDPGLKDPENITRLRIQVGLGCNYSCNYCLQRNEVAGAAKSSDKDVKWFLKNLDKWLKSAPSKIEFWGGEPLMYWTKIRALHQALTERFPGATYMMITNGSMLTDEHIEYFIKYNFTVIVSHDGPGQHNRGPDPLEDPNSYAMIKKLVDNHKMVSINSVITPDSMDLQATEKFFKDRLGKKVNTSYEGVVINYGNDQDVFPPEKYAQLSHEVFKMCLRPINEVPFALSNKMQGFLNSLVYARPSSALSQKCTMDLPSQLAVDLKGNVITCQNVGVKNHRIGHVLAFDQVRLTTSWHWSKRQECSHCPLLQLCAGSCMYTKGAEWYHSCNNEYAYNLGILAGALFHMTGWVLKEIRGEIYRPDPADYGVRTIPQ